MTQSRRKLREFPITRTSDNRQLGCSVMLESLNLGESVVFREVSHDYDKAVDRMVEVCKKITSCCNNCTVCASCELQKTLAELERVTGE